MYEDFYGLKGKPFLTVPDPSFLFWSESHQLAFTMLRYGVLNASPLTVITGDVGSGKTTLLRQLLEEFPNELKAGLISNIQADKGELLEWVLMAFEQPYDGSHVARFQRLEKFAIDNYATGRHVALIIDEAHNLGVEKLEELRMLLNINSGKDLLFQVILLGQPELRDVLGRPEMLQFTQRITSDFHLGPLKVEEVENYINRRLEVVGCDRKLFTPQTCELIYHATQGIPRLINVLCDLCLAYGFSTESPAIDETILRELMSDVERNGIFNQFTPLNSVPVLVRDSGKSSIGSGKPSQARKKNRKSDDA